MRESEGESARITAQATPSLDLIFDLLSNRHRRHALYYLYDQPDGVATIDELADAIIARQSTDSTTDGTTGDADSASSPEVRRQRIRTELQHTHLPKLEDAGVLDHDPRSKTVRYWSQPSLEEWLEHAKYKERL
ncbi:hypothetical protein RBH26_04110 [Natronolimnohabitans sp. A-GB9]|uniref:DUF7344 domain-containing protein n=1 Tax=Natronolimnohabitans sp. A-GB9 TaxID=3069757 RepID=UPI0027B284BC|nr:hypothetical protein [Natronolimnohabitans sp. A-GB9]MDQ2049661.1 hypothetical protein [Natronolimnohabitans sp. A-GB9]